MASTIHYIRQISSCSMQWNLQVHVVRLWEVPDKFKPEIPYTVELVLQDAEGDRIQASIEKINIKYFKSKIQELGLYRMKCFIVGPNNAKFKTTTHSLRLTITQKTSVEEINDPSFHMDILNLRPFDQLTSQHKVDESQLFDVVGQVVTYEAIKTHNSKENSNSVLMNIELEDDRRNRIFATLWGELVHQLQPHLNGSTEEPLIVVLQLMKAQKFRGNYSVRSCWYQTKLWINPNLPQCMEFKSRLVAARDSNYERITQTSSQQTYSIAEELTKGIVPFKKIRDLVQCTEEGYYWIAAKVVNLELNRGWSYLACTECTKKAYEDGNKYFYPKCNNDDCSVAIRYRLQFRVMDGTAFISLLLWNRDAMKLIGKSAKQLKEGLLKRSDVDADCSYPSELDDILDQKLLFKVIVKESNIVKHDEIYTVDKFTDNVDLLEEYGHFSVPDTISDPQFHDGQSFGGENIFQDCMAESQLNKNSAPTPDKKSLSESGSSVLEDGDDWNAKLSTKRSKSVGKSVMQENDDELNAKLSTNKVRKVIKKEKKP